jgi:dTDP-4-amino-4,6-dideoxygalactose transaminase
MPGYPIPLSQLPELRARCINTDANFTGAHYIATHLVTLPVHALLSARDRKRIVSWIISAE